MDITGSRSFHVYNSTMSFHYQTGFKMCLFSRKKENYLRTADMSFGRDDAHEIA